jgi:hypothetical protein
MIFERDLGVSRIFDRHSPTSPAENRRIAGLSPIYQGKLFIDHLPKLRREMVLKRFKKEKNWKQGCIPDQRREGPFPCRRSVGGG